MPKPKKDEQEKDEKEKEPTTADLLLELKKRDEIIESINSKNEELSQMYKSGHDKTNELSEQMQNITNLLGNLAGKATDKYIADYDVEEEDEKKLEELASKVAEKKYMELAEKSEKEKLAKEQTFQNAYRETIEDLLEETETPKREPLDRKAKQDLIALLTDHDEFKKVNSDNAHREARRNFSKAYKRYYGMDKTNPFKGESPAGTGINTSFKTGEEKKLDVIWSPGALKQLEKAGISQEDADKYIKRRAEKEALI